MQQLSISEIPKRIVDESNDAILFCDREGKIRYWNNRAEAVFGYRRRDILGQSIDVLIPSRYCDTHWRGFCRAMVKGRLVDSTSRPLTVTCLDGSEVDVIASLVLHCASSAEAVGVSVSFRACE